MSSVVDRIERKFAKPRITDVKSGDTVRVHQKIREGGKERVQVFEGLAIRVSRKQSHTASVTVRRVAGGIGVEKTYLLHSPLVTKVEVVKRSKVRRNYLSYMRQRTGKSARLSSVDFDREAVNKEPEPEEKPEAEAAKPTEDAKEDKPEADKTKTDKKESQEKKPEDKKASESKQTAGQKS